MTLAPWRSLLARSLDLNRSLPYARYLQLATVRTDGRPANRTVVFRGFLDDSDCLKFVIDSRSQKVAQIEDLPWGEACWYFPQTREQFRIAGQLILVHAGHPDPLLLQARQASWQDLSDAARLQFAWPHPGQDRDDAAAFAPSPLYPSQVLPNFCLLLLEPVQVDRLELKGDPQNRWLYFRNGEQTWSTQAVNP